jgi:hypothetical protein
MKTHHCKLKLLRENHIYQINVLWLQASYQALRYCMLPFNVFQFVAQARSGLILCVCVCMCVYICTVELSLTNVSFLQGRRVIYTITCHSYNGSHSLASFHNDKFLLRWCTGEHNFSVVSVIVPVACLRIPIIYAGMKSSWTQVSLWYVQHQVVLITCLNIPLTTHLIVQTFFNQHSFLEGDTVPTDRFYI